MSLMLEEARAIMVARGVAPDELEQRLGVCAEAWTWLGTPYHSHARLKGAGTDCALMPLDVFCSRGLVEDYDPGYYAPDWHLHRDEEKYLAYMERYAYKTDRTLLTALPGDLPLFRYGRTVSHSAIVIAAPIVLHAWIGLGVTLEDATNGCQADKPGRCVGVWSIWKPK